jgi:hypothetical protein
MQMEEGLDGFKQLGAEASNAQQKRGEKNLYNKDIVSKWLLRSSRMMDCQSITKLS